MKNNLHIFKSPEDLADQFADHLMNLISHHIGKPFHLAISGGKSPDLLFKVLAEKYAGSALWQNVHFWWVDERMVPSAHPESNFGVAQKLLFAQILIPEKNIHRIKGENDPEPEAVSYSEQIRESLTQRNGWPVFDLIILGMGDDGHTASIFPNHLKLLESVRICEVAAHPQSGQKRVTLTGKTINNANKVYFLVTGRGKAERIAQITGNQKDAGQYPAFYIAPNFGETSWYLDEDAAEKIS
ncbi:MAG: 6-phosphogluconolactonase [Bacteroidota bacterium]|nr:6-phosphogluconolactonase [Bacteroidota bacterium]